MKHVEIGRLGSAVINGDPIRVSMVPGKKVDPRTKITVAAMQEAEVSQALTTFLHDPATTIAHTPPHEREGRYPLLRRDIKDVLIEHG